MGDCPLTDEEIADALGIMGDHDMSVDILPDQRSLATAAYAKGRIAGLEEAAGICDEYRKNAKEVNSKNPRPFHHGRAHGAERCSMGIRAVRVRVTIEEEKSDG